MTSPATPEDKSSGLGSSQFARRYYGNLILISFPLPTKMFQFGKSRLCILWIQMQMMGYYSHRVSPFGHLRVFTPTGSPELFAGSTSFFAC